jgi:hypothetical protein
MELSCSAITITAWTEADTARGRGSAGGDADRGFDFLLREIWSVDEVTVQTRSGGPPDVGLSPSWPGADCGGRYDFKP